MKIQNMLMLLLLCLVGGMQAAAEIELETETGTVADKQITVIVCNSLYMPYYFKISKNVRNLSSDPVVWEGVPEAYGTAVNFPLCNRPLRVTIYSQKPSIADKRAQRMGYLYIMPDDVKNLKKLSLIVYAGAMASAAHDDHIKLEFNDGSTKVINFK